MYSVVNKRYLILLSVCVLSLLIRIWLVDKRWINPDEGAHLMDAVLILDGKIPSVDFGSRQPIYAYTNAAVLKLLGVSYISGRLLPMTCSLLVGLIVFLMANALYDRKVAILSASIYWMLPLELMNSVIVKTEPLVMLLTCLSLYAVILFSQSNRTVWLIVAGIFAAMGFYVRQSALIIPLTVLGFLLIFYEGRIREVAKCLGFFLMGYAGVVLLAMSYYIRFISFEEFIMGGLSPLGFLASAARKLPSLFGLSYDSASDLASQAPDLSHDKNKLYYNYVRQAFKLHSFLLIGLGFSIITVCRQVLSGNKLWLKKHKNSYLLLYLWVFSLSIAYTYYFYTQSFFIDYFREFLPPLVIIFAAWLRYAVPAFDKDEILERFVLGGLCISVILFLAAPYYKEILGESMMVCLSLALFTLFFFAGAFDSTTSRLVFQFSLMALIVIIVLSRQALLTPYLSGIVPKLAIIGVIFSVPWALLSMSARPKLKEFVRFGSYFVALGAFALSLTYSANRLTLEYDSNWSPSALEKTSAYLKSHTHSTDSVMSGAVIWELQAQRRPFFGISHPLAYEQQISKKERERLEAAIRATPPDVIILDGFTEKTYFRQVPWLKSFLSSRYYLAHTVEQARDPVQVYQQKSKLGASP